MEELTVRIVDLKGSPLENGLTQGEEIKSTKLMKQLTMLEELSSRSNTEKAEELLKVVAPHFLEELRGLAEGLKMELDHIIRLYSGYDVEFPSMGCSALITDDFYVRNYDFSPELYDARLVFSKPTVGYASVGYSQQVVGRLDGMNEKGLVVGLHFVNHEYKAEGFLATTIVRMLLEQCASMEEAVDFISSIPHGYCYNYSITDPSGKGVIVEASPQKQIVNYGPPLVCTNHFQSNSLKDKNKKEIQGSMKRKDYLSGLLTEKLTPVSSYHYFNDGNSPLFFNYYKEFFGTLHTVVYSPKDLSMITGVGENGKPTIFSLRNYLEGTINLPEESKGMIHQAY